MLESVIQAIPKEPGSYLLWLHLPQTRGLTIGKLASFQFPAGGYLYLGSALGPGGLRARLRRHLRGSDKPHWHIDRLRAVTQVRGFGYQTSAAHDQSAPHISAAMEYVPMECVWSQRLAAARAASIPIPDFGASDCRSGCPAHLIHYPGGIQQRGVKIAAQIGVRLRVIK